MKANHSDNQHLLDQAVDIAVAAGREIMSVYTHADFSVDYKQDGSPLTVADLKAHETIQSLLQNLTPNIPVLSEESSLKTRQERIHWSTFWLVDPLDGTKEFVKGNGEFTVNIALIHHSRPILGVVHAPARGLLHYAAQGAGAFSRHNGESPRKIQTRELPERDLVVVSSRSHQHCLLDRFLENAKKSFPAVRTVFMGSSLKICLVAEGVADVYPRIGPTSEWDTAAAQCVLESAGGKMHDVAGNSLEYNKPDILNPQFFATGSSKVNWAEFL